MFAIEIKTPLPSILSQESLRVSLTEFDQSSSASAAIVKPCPCVFSLSQTAISGDTLLKYCLEDHG
jgi:hypothetical protein